MEKKAKDRILEQTYPIDDPLYFVPGFVKRRAAIEAQATASHLVSDMQPCSERVELFWVIYSFEFRQQIERWLSENAKLKT